MSVLAAEVVVGGGTRFAVTGRSGGVSAAPYASLNLGGKVGDEPGAVARNRTSLGEACGVAPERLVVMAQIHSAEVALVTEPPPAPLRIDAVAAG